MNVERFVRYVKGSFWILFAASMKQAGLTADRHTAGSGSLREVGTARVDGMTGEVPAARLVNERLELQRLPAPYQAMDLCANCPALRGASQSLPISIRCWL